MARKRQTWEAGDLFAIPLADGDVVLGQVLGPEPDALNSVGIVLFEPKVAADDAARTARELARTKAFAVLLATRELLDAGAWRVVASRPPLVPVADRPYERLRAARFVGAKITGAGIVAEFVAAFHGLSPWDDWADRGYLDTLLLDPSKKPVGRLVYKHR